MSKFDKAKSAQTIKDVAKKSNEKANLITIKYYKDETLLDYPRNNEDISNTEDIEKSIMEQGFTDPMEITDYGAPEGKYYIVSGHRRRAAGKKSGLVEFPCILRHFNSDNEVYNYVLFSNAQRDSSKDPLLYAKRYKMHEDYLKEIGFSGSIAEEVANRLGLQKAQADRYKAMNKVILPIWDMVTSGAVGMSSITDSGLYTHTPEEQQEILAIMEECADNAVELTRATVSKIVKGYRDGKRSWLDVIQIEMPEVSGASSPGVSLMNINTEPSEEREKEKSPLDRNNEVNIDFSHREGLNGTDPYAGERLTEEDYEAIEKKDRQDQADSQNVTAEDKNTVRSQPIEAGKHIIHYADKLSSLLNDFYDFGAEDERAVELLGSLARDIITELNNMAAVDTSTKVKDEIVKSYELFEQLAALQTSD